MSDEEEMNALSLSQVKECIETSPMRVGPQSNVNEDEGTGLEWLSASQSERPGLPMKVSVCLLTMPRNPT